MTYKAEIKIKLPSCNDYINLCRGNKYAAAEMKRTLEDKIFFYIKDLPQFQNPIRIKFTWIESNKRRDYDNICFAKKFILDALVKAGKLKDDNRKNVYAFTDRFEYGDETKVKLQIYE